MSRHASVWRSQFEAKYNVGNLFGEIVRVFRLSRVERNDFLLPPVSTSGFESRTSDRFARRKDLTSGTISIACASRQLC